MFRTNIQGQEGYFLSEEEYLQLKQTINSVEDKLNKIEVDSL